MMKTIRITYTLLLALCMFPGVTYAAVNIQARPHRVIITGNCPFGIVLSNPLIYKQVVGVGPWAFLHADMNVLRDMKPDIDRITTRFINVDYSVNMESLLGLHPDMIFYYGKSQDDHLERAGVPVVNLDEGGHSKYDPVQAQSYWETTFEDSLGLPHTEKFSKAWGHTLKDVYPFALTIRQQHVRALYLEQSDGKILRVSGPHTYGDSYLKMAGMENVAENLKVSGDAGRYINVSMEQIMQWNPDVIFVVFGSAKAILNNRTPGQEWHGIRAWENKKVFSTPVGLHNWGGLSAETPLLPLFMISKLDPELVSEADMKTMTQRYYKNMFDYAIPNRLLNEVLSQR